MKQFTGWQYLLIDAANAMGHDKLLFETRIEWAESHLHELEALTDEADSKALYVKAVMAIRKAQAGLPTGHLVGLDACCSGMQVMSALTGCVTGAMNTGLVDPTKRADAYSTLRDVMADILGPEFQISRKPAKDALMTVLYGSREQPKKIFGEDTPELNAFYKAVYQIAPGAWELLQDLLASWRPYALVHEWKLPDGFDARVKVMTKKSVRIEVDELDHSTFTYEYYDNEGTKSGLSNVANVVHSVDAYVLRCIHRRCNYDRAMVQKAYDIIRLSLQCRMNPDYEKVLDRADERIHYYINQYNRSDMADIVILPYISLTNVEQLTTEHLLKLVTIIESMLAHNPFEVVTIHDEFKCHANNMNHLRQHYIDIFAEIADSRLLSDLMSQLYGRKCPEVKLTPNLGALIRNSNYALS